MTAKQTAQPKIGPATFWDMVALTISGQLASCVSCVEYWYFQSTANSSLFLEACASAGLLHRMPLLDLFGDVGPRVDPGQQRYDEPIFLSAPEYQTERPDEARRRLERTKKAVNLALEILYQELRADEGMIAAAYSAAIAQKKLRYSDVAASRRHVMLSPLAMLRLILDGFRAAHGDGKSENRSVILETIRFIRPFAGATSPGDATDDVGRELDQFILEFITSPEKILEVAKPAPPDDYWIKWLPVILNLAWGRFAALKTTGLDHAERFSSDFLASIAAATRREYGAEELKSLRSEWEWMEAQPPGAELPPWMSPILNPDTTFHSR